MSSTTKAAIRRQEREQQAREAHEHSQSQAQNQSPLVDTTDNGFDTITSVPRSTASRTPQIPHMEPPPPYDAPHLPSRSDSSSDRHIGLGRRPPAQTEGGCLNFGPGETEGCMNYNSGKISTVRGCMNYDAQDGCMNYRSSGGCMNYESSDGCMNYRSTEGCMNYEVEVGGGCMNYRSSRGGCLLFNRN